ncbi:MAG: tetratricopeptide repeat protein [Thermoplasmatales archaeon]
MADGPSLPSVAKSQDEYMAALELYEDGYYDEAKKHALKSLEIKENFDALSLLVDIAIKKGEEAEEYLKKLSELYPSNPETYRTYFRYYFNKNKELALSYINRAISIIKNPKYYYDKAELLFSMERYLEALASVDQAIKMENKNAKYWALRSEILLKLGRLDDARISGDLSLKLDQNCRDARIALARLYLALGDKKEAREILSGIVNMENDEEAKKLFDEAF